MSKRNDRLAMFLTRLVWWPLVIVAFAPWFIAYVDIVAYINGNKVSNIDWSNASEGLKWVAWPFMVFWGLTIVCALFEKDKF